MAINQFNITVNNKTYTSWESVEVNIDMEQLSRAFSLTTSIPNSEAISINKGDSIIIDIDGEKVLTGYIDTISISESDDSSQLILTGRDKVSDFIDSKVDNTNFATPIGFEDVLKKVLTNIGYNVVSANGLLKLPYIGSNDNKISIINNYGTIEKFSTNEGIAFNFAEEAFDLVKRLADKRGIILGTNGNGDITIDKIAPTQTLTSLIRLLEHSNINNIKRPTLKDSMANRFNEYRVVSTSSGGAKQVSFTGDSTTDPINDDLVQYSGKVYDTEIRSTRKFLGRVGALNNSQCKDRASWELNIRKGRDFSYSCDVVGFRQNLLPVNVNPLWLPNQLVYLKDERFNLDNNFLIKSVTYIQSNEDSSTRLQLIDKDSYTYALFEPLFKRQKRGKSKIVSFANTKEV